ncbi:uncharacterized protein LOC135463852 isoform X3 [Liolophura sinensis]|uniref:uncharacterized protein LOC135463852 isoform X3 n=1 Tax=Liolophura sinensis TaxID=3198878 RepID=UPI0031590E25
MGVSLERVQFKFASIIGELCSDPDVLSQFAVWLDLRLAEYKLKGAISLDCSGEEPNPLWLKGINKGKNKAVDDPVTPHRSNRTSRERARDPFPHHMTSPSQTEANPSPMERMSPEVVIKEEPSDIYPIQVHAHQNVNASFSSGSRRKRSAAETLTGDSWSQEIHDISSLSSSSSPKHKRLSSTGDSPSNQSLMSVIGGFHDNAEESTSKGDNSYNPLESSGNSASNATAMYQSDISPDFTAEPSCSFNQPSSSQDYDISIQDPAQQIQSESSENSSANDDFSVSHCALTSSKKRKVLTLQERMKVIQMAEKWKKSTRKIARELGVGKSQIQMILKRRDKMLESFNSNVPGHRKRHRFSCNNDMNQMCWEWFHKLQSRGVRITGPQLQVKALELANKLGNKSFKASSGWLECFVKRNNISLGKKPTPQTPSVRIRHQSYDRRKV